MSNIEITTPIKKLERARKAVDVAKENYRQIVEGLSRHDPKISERSTILCKKCGKRSQARNIKFSRYYWYESPHGCIGGDAWHWDGYIVSCSKCGNWEKINCPSKSLSNNYDVQVMEFRIIEKMLRFAQQYGDVRYSNGDYEFTNEIEWKHE